MIYAHGLTPLAKNAAEECNFQTNSGTRVDTYRFITALCVLWVIDDANRTSTNHRQSCWAPIDLPGKWSWVRCPTSTAPEILGGLSNTYSFTDDISVVTKGTNEVKTRNVPERLDSMIFHLKLEKCKCTQREDKCLGFHFSQTSFKTLIVKIKEHRTLWNIWIWRSSGHS